MSGSGSKAAKALRQLEPRRRGPNLTPPQSHASPQYYSPHDDQDDPAYSDSDDEEQRLMTQQSHQQKVLARLARKEAEEQSKLEQQRKRMIQRRKIKTQQDMFNKIVFDHSNNDTNNGGSTKGANRMDDNYYQYLPIKPGIEAYKWLVPMREETVGGKKHYRPGLDALQIIMPDTILYSERYAGVAETWLSTNAKGMVVSKRLGKKWIPKFSQKANTAIDTSTSSIATSTTKVLKLRRPVSVLKISHWKNNESRNITRVIPEYSLPAALKAPTPGAVCIQNYVHSRGVHSSCYRVVWNAYKPATGFMISSEKSYQEREPSSTVGASTNHTGALVDDFLSTTHLASIEHRSEEARIPITVFELNSKAIAGPIKETKKIVQYLERVKTKSGGMKFDQMVCDFIKRTSKNKDEWVFLQIKSFAVSPTCWSRCKKLGISRNVSARTAGERKKKRCRTRRR